MKIFLIKNFLLILVLTLNVYSGDGLSYSTPPDKLQKIKAWNRYKEGDYYGALRIYRELYDKNKNDIKLNYHMGLCYLALQDMENAIIYFGKAIEINNKAKKSKLHKKIYFELGQAYQYLGNIDKALEKYNIYQRSLRGVKAKNDPVNKLILQCNNARNMMANPVKVKIKNLGPNINSEYDDAAPSISADGKILVFTSRRPDTKGGKIDPNTGNYFDDIYISTWNEEKNMWNSAKDAPGNLNSEGHDASLSISPDGKTIFLYRNVEGETGSGDIFISTIKDDHWTSPKRLAKPINTSFFESSACLSPDGKYLYFVSERPGGYGNADIWVSKQIGKDEWEKSKNLGPIINTEEDELSVFIHPDGETLFFTSKGHNSIGGYDIFVSRFKDGKWLKPENLGYPINTTKDELHFTLTADGKKAYISSRKEGGLGGADIYEIDLSEYEFPLQEVKKDTIIAQETPKSVFNPEIAILRGKIIDADAGQILSDVEIIISDALTEEIITTSLSDDTGNYFIILRGNKEYIININKNGYKNYIDKISLPTSKEKTFILDKTIVLERLPNK